MSGIYSLSRWAVDSTNYKLSAPEAVERTGILENAGHAVKTAGRLAGRATLDTVMIPVSLIETVFFGVFRAVLFLPSFAGYETTTSAYEWAKEHTVVAFDALKNASKGIVGYGRVAAPAAPITGQRTALTETQQLSHVIKAQENHIQALKEEIAQRTPQNNYEYYGMKAGALTKQGVTKGAEALWNHKGKIAAVALAYTANSYFGISSGISSYFSGNATAV